MNYQYINCITEFGLHQATLILTDPDGVIPDYRIDKVFQDDVTPQEMQDEAESMIEFYIASRVVAEEVTE